MDAMGPAHLLTAIMVNCLAKFSPNRRAISTTEALSSCAGSKKASPAVSMSGAGSFFPFRCAKKDVGETNSWFFVIFFRMLLEIGLEVQIGRATSRCEIFGQKFKFLSHPSSDNNVVLIEAHSC